MAMSDEERAKYQRDGRHFRNNQKTPEQKAAIDNRVHSDDRLVLVAIECRELLKSIRRVLIFFTVLALLGLLGIGLELVKPH
jgi:hypothetical protein